MFIAFGIFISPFPQTASMVPINQSSELLSIPTMEIYEVRAHAVMRRIMIVRVDERR